MTPEELAAKCRKAIDHPGALGKFSVVLRGGWPKGGRKRIAKGGPFGECVAEYDDGVLCAFDAREVLAWLEKEGTPNAA